MNTPSTRSPENEYEKLALCLRTIAWCSENGWKYPGDMVMVPAGNMLDEKNSQLEAVKAELEAAKKCGTCGSTDLVCGKGWKTERDKLKAQLSEKEAEIERLTKSLECVVASDDAQADLEESLKAQLKKCEEGLKWAWPYVANVQPKTEKSEQVDALIGNILSTLHPSKQENI